MDEGYEIDYDETLDNLRELIGVLFEDLVEKVEVKFHKLSGQIYFVRTQVDHNKLSNESLAINLDGFRNDIIKIEQSLRTLSDGFYQFKNIQDNINFYNQKSLMLLRIFQNPLIGD